MCFPFYVLLFSSSLLAFLYCLRCFCIISTLVSFSPVFYLLFSLIFFLSFPFLFVSLSLISTIFYVLFPFFVSCFVSLLSFCVRLQNCKKRLLTSSCLSVRLSVRPHGTTRLQLDGYLLNFTFEYFPKVCREKSRLIEI